MTAPPSRKSGDPLALTQENLDWALARIGVLTERSEAQAGKSEDVRHQLEGAVDLLEQAVDLIAQPSIPDHARKRWQTAVDELLGDGTAAGGR